MLMIEPHHAIARSLARAVDHIHQDQTILASNLITSAIDDLKKMGDRADEPAALAMAKGERQWVQVGIPPRYVRTDVILWINVSSGFVSTIGGGFLAADDDIKRLVALLCPDAIQLDPASKQGKAP